MEEKLAILKLKHEEVAGLSLFEYMRRRFFGGRPLVAHADIMLASELRRVVLFKHNFETLRQGNAGSEWTRKWKEHFVHMWQFWKKSGQPTGMTVQKSHNTLALPGD